MILGLVVTLSLFGQIKNPDKPARGNWDFQMKKIWQVQQAGPHDIARLQNFDLSADGRIYVLDPKNYKIFILNPKGEFISVFGKKGEGPGEIKYLGAGQQLFVRNQRIFILDRGRIHHITLQGKYLTSIRYPGNLHPRAFLSDHSFVAFPSVVDNPKYKVTWYDVDKKSKKTIVKYSVYNKGKRAPKVRPIVVGGLTPMMYGNCGGGKFYYGVNTGYLINITNEAGDQIGSFSIPERKRERVSEKYLNWLRGVLSRHPPEKIKRYIDYLPKKVGHFDFIFLDNKGLVYVQRVDMDNKNIRKFDIFSSGGKYLYYGELTVQQDLIIKELAFKDNVLLLALEDQEGSLSVAKYAILIPSQ